jgi:hypothetical protein
VKLVHTYGAKNTYENDDQVLYRGMKLDVSDSYKKHDIGFWPCYTSTTETERVARTFRGNTAIPGTIFKIYCSK